ncbi:MAG TPA: cobalamin B12-binding domain-containing protein [Anaerolineaceae bacterium]|nr:cobalamin B12-binding domain-containing protein [Anaerolineaceae bacterium]
MKTVVAGALGECVHVAGISSFLRIAEQLGWRTIFLGPAVPPERLIQAAKDENADLVGISYRLTPENGERLLAEFAEQADELHQKGVRFVFGGTPPVAEKARQLEGFFDNVFDGSEEPEILMAYLRGGPAALQKAIIYPQTLLERIQQKAPFPVLRHHFGLPSMEKSLRGIELIAEAKALDVISLGIDQDAQENFYHLERQNPRTTGAGGVPVRSPEDYKALYAASRRGNFPLLRTYSGTDDFIRLAEMYVETINIAWCAIPLFWFNLMDGRGPLTVKESIVEHQTVMRWYGARNIPVELNEPHHWGMRDASDAVFVTSAFLSAWNAKAMGVKDYIAQMMFNSPAALAGNMDLARMLAILELVSPLEDDNFRVIKQTRTGLLSYPLEPNAARAHLASSIYLQMILKPHIIHVVGHTEADHAATGEDVIEASLMAKWAIKNALNDNLNISRDPIIQRRVKDLKADVELTLQAIRNLAGKGVEDPLTDPTTLAKAVEVGILDAPQLKNNVFAPGLSRTAIINGASVEVDASGTPVHESKRLAEYLERKK